MAVVSEDDRHFELAKKILGPEDYRTTDTVTVHYEDPFNPKEDAPLKEKEVENDFSERRTVSYRRMWEQLLYHPVGIETCTLWLRDRWVVVANRGYYGHKGENWDYSKTFYVYRRGDRRGMQKLTFGPNAYSGPKASRLLPEKNVLEYMDERNWLHAAHPEKEFSGLRTALPKKFQRKVFGEVRHKNPERLDSAVPD